MTQRRIEKKDVSQILESEFARLTEPTTDESEKKILNEMLSSVPEELTMTQLTRWCKYDVEKILSEHKGEYNEAHAALLRNRARNILILKIYRDDWEKLKQIYKETRPARVDRNWFKEQNRELFITLSRKIRDLDGNPDWSFLFGDLGVPADRIDYTKQIHWTRELVLNKITDLVRNLKPKYWHVYWVRQALKSGARQFNQCIQKEFTNLEDLRDALPADVAAKMVINKSLVGKMYEVMSFEEMVPVWTDFVRSRLPEKTRPQDIFLLNKSIWSYVIKHVRTEDMSRPDWQRIKNSLPDELKDYLVLKREVVEWYPGKEELEETIAPLRKYMYVLLGVTQSADQKGKRRELEAGNLLYNQLAALAQKGNQSAYNMLVENFDFLVQEFTTRDDRFKVYSVNSDLFKKTLDACIKNYNKKENFVTYALVSLRLGALNLKKPLTFNDLTMPKS